MIGVAAFLLIRIAVVLLFGRAEPPPSGDLMVYFQTARELAGSGSAWLRPGGEFGYRAPLFFVYLAGLFRAYPEAPYKAAQIYSALPGVLASLLLFRIADRIGGRRAAWIAFGIRGLLPPFVILDTFVLTEGLFSLLLFGAVLLALRSSERPSYGDAAALGAVAGAATLARDSALLFPFLFGLLVFLGFRGRRRAPAGLAAYGAALVLVISPWMIRNASVWGEPLPIAQTSGVNLHIGNNPETTGKHMDLPTRAPDGLRWGSPDYRRWHSRQARAFIRENPGAFVRNGFKKVSWLLFPSFHRDFLRTAYAMPGAMNRIVTLFSGTSSAIWILISLAGFVLARRSIYWWIALVLALYIVGGTAVAHGHPRYRDPIDQILIPYGSLLIADPRSFGRALLRGSRLRAGLLVLLALLILLAWAWVGLRKTSG
ncbi:MAG: glycosyltransferase family 39 protein [Candidatus Eisenbacteria bacterium]